RICRISENDLKPSFSCDAGTAMAGVLCPYPQAIFQHSPLKPAISRLAFTVLKVVRPTRLKKSRIARF
ncbi:MAG: hypothetical protein FWC70_06405, partial [Defluviitaleaceae bacterium]|nr:hypothetical protein [Defluviitaleaceae bacterium]